MRPAVASLTTPPYAHTVRIGPHNLPSDVTAEEGGADAGPSPHEYLAASLASCTAITLHMYAKRKNWDITGLAVSVSIEHPQAGQSIFKRTLQVPSALSDEQRQRLVAIANACPVHKTLSGSITIDTQLTQG